MAYLHQLVSTLMADPKVGVTIYALLSFLGLDVFLGIIAALRQKTFQWVKVADFVDGDMLGVLVVLAFGMGAQNPYLATAFYAGAAALLATLAAKINVNFKAVFGVDPHIEPPVLPQEPAAK